MMHVALPAGMRLCSEAEAAALVALPNAAHLAPAIDAALEGRIELAILPHPAAPWPSRFLRETARPTLVLVCDDPGSPEGNGGPGAWRCADRIGRWCAASIIHGAAGKAWHYAEAARATLRFQKLVVVETTGLHVLPWQHRIACETTLLIVPKDGTHPTGERVLH